MNYQDYKDARDASWHILIDCKVTELPVRISGVCRALGVPVRRYTPAERDNNDGMSSIIGGAPTILVSDLAIPARQRFTCAHELGHIILGHVGRYDLVCREPDPGDNPIEQAANVFASRLLAPACVLWGCGVQSADEIAALCDISRAAAEFRWSRMQELYRRQRFLTSPLERWYMRNSRITSKVIGFGELVNECFQSGDLFVAQFLLNIGTITAGDFHDVSAVGRLGRCLRIIAVTIWVGKFV